MTAIRHRNTIPLVSRGSLACKYITGQFKHSPQNRPVGSERRLRCGGVASVWGSWDGTFASSVSRLSWKGLGPPRRYVFLEALRTDSAVLRPMGGSPFAVWHVQVDWTGCFIR